MKNDDEALVTLAEFENRFEAGLARGALEAIGIRVLVPEENMWQPTHASPARLQVLESDKERALTELARLQIRLVKGQEADG